MPEPNEMVSADGIEDGPRHDHLCLVYQGESELIPSVVTFIQQGVKSGERCIYLNAGQELLDRVIKNAVAAQKNGVKVLVALSEEEVWLQESRFDPVRVMGLLRQLCLAAETEGYKGVRIICDMGWAYRDGVVSEHLLDFEARLNFLVAEQHAALLCLYDRRSFSAELLLEVAKLHPSLDLAGKICKNTFHLSSEEYLRPSRRSSELDCLFAAVQAAAGVADEQRQLRQELEQAYAALARKIYENWQEEDTLRASEQQLNEQNDALKEHKRRLQTILQHMPVLVASFDVEHRLVSCNHEFERVTGFRAEEVVGKRMLELFATESEAAEELLLAHPTEGGSYKAKEWVIKAKDGGIRPVSWFNMSRYVTIAGWSNWIMGIDMTQRLQAEEKLRHLANELRQQAREVEQLSCEVSQELGGQLTKISGHCRDMQKLCGAELPPICAKLLQEINDASVEMVERMATLLRFIMLAAGDFTPEEVDLSAMATEIAEKLTSRGGEQKVTFSIEEGVVVHGDGKLLRLALEQLLENAWRYAKRKEHAVIGFGTVQMEGEKSIFVSGEGARLPEGGRDKKGPWRFDPHGGPGSDIALATVQRIISLHHGRLWAAHGAGKGATFLFRV